jgi:hypothetical protein
MNVLGRILVRVCDAAALVGFAMGFSLALCNPVSAGCIDWCASGDCTAKGVPPLCKDNTGVQMTCPYVYYFCDSCACHQAWRGGVVQSYCECPNIF